jgi:hypothetical protein
MLIDPRDLQLRDLQDGLNEIHALIEALIMLGCENGKPGIIGEEVAIILGLIGGKVDKVNQLAQTKKPLTAFT